MERASQFFFRWPLLFLLSWWFEDRHPGQLKKKLQDFLRPRIRWHQVASVTLLIKASTIQDQIQGEGQSIPLLLGGRTKSRCKGRCIFRGGFCGCSLKCALWSLLFIPFYIKIHVSPLKTSKVPFNYVIKLQVEFHVICTWSRYRCSSSTVISLNLQTWKFRREVTYPYSSSIQWWDRGRALVIGASVQRREEWKEDNHHGPM